MQKGIVRTVQPQLEKLLATKQVVVLTGMRRTGKTTLLKHYFQHNKSENKIYLNFEDVLTRRIFDEQNYQNIKRSLEEEGLNFGEKAYIYIDEIQYIENSPSVIKYLYDEYDIKFFVTGSSSYYLKNKFSESLAGRKFILELFPFNFKEFLAAKNVEKDYEEEYANKVEQKSLLRTEKYNDLYAEYVRFGGFPEVVLQPDYELKTGMLRDILTSYFQIDVANLADFNDVAKLRDLLTLLTQRVGQRLDMTALSSALGISRQKVYEYLEFLQATYIISLVSQHSSLDNQISASQKLYFADTGLISILGSVDDGSLLENAIYNNLKQQGVITYYQAASGKEIDFILAGRIGLEVKVTPTQKHLANLRKRAAAIDLSECYLIGTTYVAIDQTLMAWDV